MTHGELVEQCASIVEDVCRYASNYSTNYNESIRPPCNGIGRAFYVLVGLVGLIFSYGGLVYTLQYGIDKDSKKGKAFAATVFVLSVAGVVQGAMFLINSTAADCGAKDVGVQPVVIPELKFGDVQRQIFAADLMETAHYPPESK
jgi:hypothetical protein